MRELAQKITVPGVRPSNAIEQILSQYLAASIKSYIGDRLIKPPNIKLMRVDAQQGILTLPELTRKGYTTWYPEIRFSTKPSDAVVNITVEPTGISLGNFASFNETPSKCKITVKTIKTQTNHILKFQGIMISGHIFECVREYIVNASLDSPYIANPYPRFDGEILFHKVVTLDQVLNGSRVFCSCAQNAHQKMIADAKKFASEYMPRSPPQQLIHVLTDAQYVDSICHLCIAHNLGADAAADRYGDTVQDFVDAYVVQLMLTDEFDDRTAKAEVQTRLGLSRWIQEAKMYRLIKQLFSDDTVLREASPPWLGRQRLDVFLPDLRLALEYQGAQHYEPIEMFGGAEALQRTMERDALKKRLCDENQVDLVYIKHSDPLTFASLRQRLRRFIAS
ncbi:MAG: hypothetical protein ACRES7_06535 [Gammaproteobacteria bacterium]